MLDWPISRKRWTLRRSGSFTGSAAPIHSARNRAILIRRFIGVPGGFRRTTLSRNSVQFFLQPPFGECPPVRNTARRTPELFRDFVRGQSLEHSHLYDCPEPGID